MQVVMTKVESLEEFKADIEKYIKSSLVLVEIEEKDLGYTFLVGRFRRTKWFITDDLTYRVPTDTIRRYAILDIKVD